MKKKQKKFEIVSDPLGLFTSCLELSLNLAYFNKQVDEAGKYFPVGKSPSVGERDDLGHPLHRKDRHGKKKQKD